MSMENLQPRTMEDCLAALHELQAANEELRRQNGELTACRQALEAHGRQYRQLFDFIPDAYVVTNVQGGILEANRAALSLFKMSRDLLKGKSLGVFFANDGLESFHACLYRLQASKQSEEWEIHLQSSDGVEFPASIVVTVADGAPGQELALHWLIRDLTTTRRTVNALEESEERYRVILEHSPLGILHIDPNGIVANCNRQFLNIVGAAREKVLGFNMFQSLRDPAMRAAFLEALSGRIGYYEGDYRSVTGEKVTPLRVLYSQVTTDDGVLLGVVGIWEDITDRKLAEDALRESEERYRVLFEHSPLGILHVDPNGIVVNCNRQFLNIVGSSKERNIGLNMFQTLRDPAMREAFEKSLSGMIGHYEGNYRSATGDKVTPLRVLYSRLSTDDGISLGTVGIWEDITARKLAEDALRESEERYRVLFEHSPLGILHFDQKGNVVSYNRHFLEIIGASEEKVVGFNMLQSLRDEAMHAAVVKALSGEMSRFEGDYRSVISGKHIPLRVLFSRITADDGRLLGAVGIYEDITERKQAEAARRELSRQRLEACNTVAHELRNSLIKIGFVFPAINSVMSFLREQWELELRKAFPDLEDKSAILMRLGELALMGQPCLEEREDLARLSEELVADQVIMGNLFLLPQHGKSWLDNKIRPKWRRLLTECGVWKKSEEDVPQLLDRLEVAIRVVADEDLARKMEHLPEDLRIKWPKLAYTEFSTANLSLLEDVLRLLDHSGMPVIHKQQLSRLLTSLKALADLTALIEDRMNRMLAALKSGEQSEAS